MRQSRPRPSSRVSRTWQEVPTLSSQVYLNSTFLTDKGCAPARPALHVWKPPFADYLPRRPFILVSSLCPRVYVLWKCRVGRSGARPYQRRLEILPKVSTQEWCDAKFGAVPLLSS